MGGVGRPDLDQEMPDPAPLNAPRIGAKIQKPAPVRRLP